MNGGAGLYLHVPFCSAICPYCDFAVTTGSRESRATYCACLRREVALYADCGLSFDTVYFGGGTPSALDAEDLASTLDAVRRSLDLATEAWISLEANPEDVDRTNLDAWRALGVKTLSLGVQSFDAAELKFLGRRHDPDASRDSVHRALEAGFPTVSVDLIYGLPEQTAASWKHNLSTVASIGPHHVSCYQLTVHDGTPFARRRQDGRLRELPAARQADLFRITHERLAESGFHAYEVSNFARTPEHESRHNKKYWDHTPYLGLGLAAHSYIDRVRWWNDGSLPNYEKRVAAGEPPVAGREELSQQDLALEAVMLGLRTTSGVDLDGFRRRFGVDLVQANARQIDEFVARGLARADGGRLRLTGQGLAVADSIAASLEIGPPSP